MTRLLFPWYCMGLYAKYKNKYKLQTLNTRKNLLQNLQDISSTYVDRNVLLELPMTLNSGHTRDKESLISRRDRSRDTNRYSLTQASYRNGDPALRQALTSVKTKGLVLRTRRRKGKRFRIKKWKRKRRVDGRSSPMMQNETVYLSSSLLHITVDIDRLETRVLVDSSASVFMINKNEGNDLKTYMTKRI